MLTKVSATYLINVSLRLTEIFVGAVNRSLERSSCSLAFLSSCSCLLCMAAACFLNSAWC